MTKLKTLKVIIFSIIFLLIMFIIAIFNTRFAQKMITNIIATILKSFKI